MNKRANTKAFLMQGIFPNKRIEMDLCCSDCNKYTRLFKYICQVIKTIDVKSGGTLKGLLSPLEEGVFKKDTVKVKCPL